MAKLNVILISTAIHPRCGGPFESVAGLARGLASDENTAVTVVASTASQGTLDEFAKRIGRARLSVHRGNVVGRLRSASRYIDARARAGSVDVIHASGLWDGTSVLVRMAEARWNVPIVWSPRGMLEPWALGHHRCRKMLAWVVLQRAALHEASLLHATADSEAISCRKAGLLQPIATIPNGIDVEPLIATRNDHELDRIRRCAYLGRLHPKKGLPNLIEAWSRCDTTGWELVIAGPDSGGHAVSLSSTIANHGLGNVRIVGPRYGDDKRRFFEQCDLFVCPSFSENFGIAIAEAMERGKPVITTHGTPWSVLNRDEMGWWVEPSIDGLTHALGEALGSDSERLQEMGARGRRHVEHSYSWEAIVSQMRAAYEWFRGGPYPACVTSTDVPAMTRASAHARAMAPR